MTETLPTELTLMAQLRAISARGDFYTVLYRGDPHSGLILLKWRVRDGVALYIQERDFDDGTLKWQQVLPQTLGVKPQTQNILDGSLDDRAVEDYMDRAMARDPDVWVIEIETRDTVFPLDGRVI